MARVLHHSRLVLPFSKRPPPPEEYFLRSGDFEAVRQDSYSGPAPHGYAQAIPPAPRAPVFARQAAQTPYGFAQNQQNQYGSGQYGSLSAPPPPHSLAPVAMGANDYRGPDSTGRNLAYTTSRTNGTVVVREKPSLKWGVMIALTGALLGGVLGLGMDARRQNARAAAAAADARDNAPPAMVAAALPNALTATPRPVAPPVRSRPSRPSRRRAAVPGNVIAPPAPVVLAAVAPVVVAPKTTDVAPKATHTAAKTAACAEVALPRGEGPDAVEARAREGGSARAEDRQGRPARDEARQEGSVYLRRDEDPRSGEQRHDEHALITRSPISML